MESRDSKAFLAVFAVLHYHDGGFIEAADNALASGGRLVVPVLEERAARFCCSKIPS